MKCAKGPYLRIKETDDEIWNKVVEVMEQSHLYREEIKRISLNAKKADSAGTIDSRSFQSQIRRTEREIQEVKRSIVSVESDRIIRQRGGDIVEGILKNLDEHLQSIEARRLDLLLRLKKAAKMKRWTNWVADFGTRITELKTMQDEAKKEFLEGVVGRINATSLGKNRYECAVHFRLPYVEDRLVKATGIGAKKTSRFTVEDGRDTTTVPLVFAPVKRRRRKQS